LGVKRALRRRGLFFYCHENIMASYSY